MAEPKLRIACIGECMIELTRTSDGSLQQQFAGDTANLAVYLARLLPAPEARVAYVTALGQDEFSAAMLAAWQQEGIDTAMVRQLPDRLPGLYWITTSPQGERSFHYWRDNSAARAMLTGGYAATLGRSLAGVELVCLSGITLAILTRQHRAQLMELLGHLRNEGSRIAFDSNYRQRLWRNTKEARQAHEDLLRMAHTALVSFDDERALFGDASPAQTNARIRGWGIEEVVIRHGAQPCVVSVADHDFTVPTPVAGTAVDTTAAGDSFDAAYLAARSRGVDPVSAALAGHRLAARVIQHPGAILPRTRMPTWTDLLD